MPIGRKTAVATGWSRTIGVAIATGCLLWGVRAPEAGAAPPAVIPLPQKREPLKEHCLAIADIRASRVASDEAVILFLKDGRVVAMRLKRACPQLLFHRRFRFAGEMGQICAELDRIVTRAGLRCSIAGFSLLPCAGMEEAAKPSWCRPPFSSPDSQAPSSVSSTPEFP